MWHVSFFDYKETLFSTFLHFSPLSNYPQNKKGLKRSTDGAYDTILDKNNIADVDNV
jgi:hypothetical protein